MKPLKLWIRVGSPTWKRSGTLVFTAVIGVLLVGGTAMAANLGLLTGTTSADRGYRLSVPRPALSVTLPTTDPEPPDVDTTSVSEDADESGDAHNGGAAESTTTEPPHDHGSVHHEESTAGGSEGASDDGNHAEVDNPHPDQDAQPERRPDDPARRDGKSEGDAGEADTDRWSPPGGDGRLDDD